MIDGNHTTQELADQSDSSQPQCALFPRDPQFSPVRWLSDIPHVLNENQGPDGLARSDAPKNMTKNGGFLLGEPWRHCLQLGIYTPNSIGNSPEDLNWSLSFCNLPLVVWILARSRWFEEPTPPTVRQAGDVAMGQYLLNPMKIPFLMGWTSIYQLFWGSPGVPGFWLIAMLQSFGPLEFSSNATGPTADIDSIASSLVGDLGETGWV
jgi:hypothetical protein